MFSKTFLYFVLIPALLPVIIIFRKVYGKDIYEPEPLPFVLFVLGMGAVSCIPAALLESIYSALFEPIFSTVSYRNTLINFTLGVGLPEELVKWLVLMIFVWNNKNFDHRYDGIVYATTSSLGFAALENVLYVWKFGTSVAIGRALFSIPGHTTFGVFMGYYLSRAKDKAIQNQPVRKRYYLIKSLVVSIIIHAIYDSLLSEPFTYNSSSVIVFFLYVLIIVFLAKRKIDHDFRKDKILGMDDRRWSFHK